MNADHATADAERSAAPPTLSPDDVLSPCAGPIGEGDTDTGASAGDQPVEYLPKLIAWEVTRSCNLSCRHCRASAEKGPYPGELTLDRGQGAARRHRVVQQPGAHHDRGRPADA